MTTNTPGDYRVLVVDDDESVRRVTMRALELFGFATIGAGNGFEAIDTVRNGNPPIDCAIVDMSMPGLDGEETMRRLHEVAATLPVLLASGLSTDEMPGQGIDAAFAGYIQKPYQIGALAQSVREAIEAARRSGRTAIGG